VNVSDDSKTQLRRHNPSGVELGTKTQRSGYAQDFDMVKMRKTLHRKCVMQKGVRIMRSCNQVLLTWQEMPTNAAIYRQITSRLNANK